MGNSTFTGESFFFFPFFLLKNVVKIKEIQGVFLKVGLKDKT